MTTFRMLTAALLVATLVWGCDDAPEDTVEPEPEATNPEGTEEAVDEEPAAVEGAEADPEAGPLVEETTFELRATAAESYASGELAQFAIQITPKGEWHMNDEFPTTVTVREVDGVTFPKSDFEKSDAAEFAERSARFDVPFTASAAGEHRVVCDVSFAVCTDENCIPEERTLAVLLPVQ